MSAQLLPHLRVEHPLEQSAKDRRFNVRPVKCIEARQYANLLSRDLVGNIVILEQPPVEVRNVTHVEVAAGIHGGEELSEIPAKCLIIPGLRVVFHDVRESFGTQKPDVRRKHAEKNARNEARYPHVVDLPLMELLADLAE